MKLKGNNLIIVNILATYARMVLVAGMSIFSARWVLKALGKEDFGLYSVVGGLIVFIMFIGSTMAGSVQRFYAYAIGQGDPEKVKRWFNSAFVLHAGFSILLVIVGVPLGNYLIDYVMNIPEGRVSTCHWVYYLSILGAVATMLTTPYLAMFYAQQRIFELSFWSLLGSTLSFSLAWYLLRASGDLLIIYAAGMVFIKLILDVIQIVRAWVLFDSCRLCKKYFFIKNRFKEMLTFAGWRLFGNLGDMAKVDGLAFLLNVFHGPLANAAFGISKQVSGQASNISSAVYQAITPEITSREGAGNREGMISFSLRSNKFLVLMTFLWLIPLYVGLDYLLSIWLVDVPEQAGAFCKIAILAYLFDKLSISYYVAICATGKLAGYQLSVGALSVGMLLVALVGFKLGISSEYVLYSMVITGGLVSVCRAVWVKILLDIPISRWVNEVVLKSSYAVLPAVVIAWLLSMSKLHSIALIGVVTLTTFICVSVFSWLFSFSELEKSFLSGKFKRIFLRCK